jgi:hypothetical protein
MVMSGPTDGVIAINTPIDLRGSVPVLQVGKKERPTLDAASNAGSPVTLIIQGPGGERTGYNTVATSGSVGPWVVVSTPQSGWFNCGGERGPGIAIARALSTWAISSGLPVRWLFVSTSGHEWVDHGATLFHELAAPAPDETALWYHLGAGFGARAFVEQGSTLIAQSGPNQRRAHMATQDLHELIAAVFAGQPIIDRPLAADATLARGEFRLLLERGYRTAAGFWGANAHFHTPADGSNSTTAEVMEPIARAISHVIRRKLERLPGA